MSFFLAGLFFTFQVNADQTIGVNFCGNNSTYHMTGKTVLGLSNWTDSLGSNGSDLVVLGTIDQVSCDWASSGFWYDGPYETAEEQLYRLYLDDNRADGVVIRFSGLSDLMASEELGSYIIRVYHNSDKGGESTIFSTVYVFDENGTVNSGGTVLDEFTATDIIHDDERNRAIVEGNRLTADTITIDLADRDTSIPMRGTVSAVMIIGFDAHLAFEHSPETGVEVPPAETLTWHQNSLISGRGIYYDLYLGTDPNELSEEYYGLSPVKTTTDLKYAKRWKV